MLKNLTVNSLLKVITTDVWLSLTSLPTVSDFVEGNQLWIYMNITEVIDTNCSQAFNHLSINLLKQKRLIKETIKNNFR